METREIFFIKGKHIIHVGGKYDSYLLIPVVPEK